MRAEDGAVTVCLNWPCTAGRSTAIGLPYGGNRSFGGITGSKVVKVCRTHQEGEKETANAYRGKRHKNVRRRNFRTPLNIYPL